eukprot:CAMPEP_0197853568 /NCGR_PEP_ID=MMETSP1438-20131217/22990_1 /TAXON_ID=1461541 /ORGANISM="Pterosperma sp., Strain CCMP1384" /LENGTH=226 /DNA_ID=CAMNT_0043468033 /DNA_START=31 /DNA_END=711 /DNA_ORIENTATION=-
MTFFHMVNCGALTFGPHAIYYYATPLSDYDTWSTSLKGGFFYVGAFFAKLVCLAAFVSTETAGLDLTQELIQACIGAVDVVALYFALTRITARVSLDQKFQAVGLGYAIADSIIYRAGPLWLGARKSEFSWKWLQNGGHANANLIWSISFASVVSLLWNRKSKPDHIVPLLYASIALHAVLPNVVSIVRQLLNLDLWLVVALDVALSVLCALASYSLYSAASRPRP